MGSRNIDLRREVQAAEDKIPPTGEIDGETGQSRHSPGASFSTPYPKSAKSAFSGSSGKTWRIVEVSSRAVLSDAAAFGFSSPNSFAVARTCVSSGMTREVFGSHPQTPRSTGDASLAIHLRKRFIRLFALACPWQTSGSQRFGKSPAISAARSPGLLFGSLSKHLPRLPSSSRIARSVSQVALRHPWE